jgi:Holliday junction resolvase
MPNFNYRKGYRVEREIYRRFKEAGFKVYRSAGSHTEADLIVEGIGSIQVKARKKYGIYDLFEGADVLVVKADRKEPLIVTPISKFLKLLR